MGGPELPARFRFRLTCCVGLDEVLSYRCQLLGRTTLPALHSTAHEEPAVVFLTPGVLVDASALKKFHMLFITRFGWDKSTRIVSPFFKREHKYVPADQLVCKGVFENNQRPFEDSVRAGPKGLSSGSMNPQ